MRKFFAHALVEGQDPLLEYILEILNLKDVQHKLTGEAISDVDRQKLTTAELALGTYSVMLYDQPLSGSDLAATYDLVDTIRTVSRIQHSSVIMSLTQLSEEVFNLFDRLILLGNGQVIYQGPRQDAIPYFYKLGSVELQGNEILPDRYTISYFLHLIEICNSHSIRRYQKPLHVETAEFLEDIVAGFGSQYMVPEATTLSFDELTERYRASDQYKDIVRIITGDRVKHIYWVESEPGLGLSLKTPSNNNPSNYKSSTETGKLVLQTSKLMNSYNFSTIKFILQQR